MLCARTLRRLVCAVLLSAGIAGLLAPTSSGAAPSRATSTVKPIVFPVDGTVRYSDTWGAARSGGRTHEGTDLMGKQMQPLLAAVDGTVVRVRFDNLSTGGNSVVIQGADGWTYHYVHVNNDTPGTDDGRATRAQAFPPDIVAGATVRRGQVVAYMGDSGNAEHTAHHLHFEIRQPAPPGGWIGSGTAINPYESLRRATVWSSTSHWALRRTATSSTIDAQFTYGMEKGDRALLCDWDGDGLDEPVIVRGTAWYLRSGLPSGVTAGQFEFGSGGEEVLCGDVDGEVGDEPILFAAGGTWTIRAGFGSSDAIAWTVRYGMTPGDHPVLGDWDDDGDEDIAIHRRGTWYLRTTATPSGTNLRQFTYGVQPGDLPVAGDWDGDGDTDAGVFRQGTFHLRSTAEVAGGTARSILSGAPGDQPVSGEWTAGTATGFGHFRPRRA